MCDEKTGPGDFFREESVVGPEVPQFRARVLQDTRLYFVPGKLISRIPIVQLKLLEAYERRMRMADPAFSLNL